MPRGVWIQGSEGKKTALEKYPNPLPPETSREGGWMFLQAAAVNYNVPKNFLGAPADQVSCFLEKWQGLYFHTQLLCYDLVGKKLWMFLQLPSADLFLMERSSGWGAMAAGGRVMWQVFSAHILEQVVWGMVWDIASLSKARLGNPVGQLSWEPYMAAPFWHRLRKTTPPFLMTAEAKAWVKKQLPFNFLSQLSSRTGSGKLQMFRKVAWFREKNTRQEMWNAYVVLGSAIKWETLEKLLYLCGLQFLQ